MHIKQNIICNTHKIFKCLDQEYGTILYALRVDMASDLIKKKSIPLFYKECITSFQEILKCTKTMRNRNDEIIWDNSEIMPNNKPIRMKLLSKSGILRREDIVNVHGEIDEELIRSNVEGGRHVLGSDSYPYSYLTYTPYLLPTRGSYANDDWVGLTQGVYLHRIMRGRILSNTSNSILYSISLRS